MYKLKCSCKPALRTKASLRDKEIILKKIVETGKDAVGGRKVEYIEQDRAWARVKGKRAGEGFVNEAIEEFTDNVFVTDYDSVKDLVLATNRAEWRLFLGVDIYSIKTVINVGEDNNDVEIIATKGVAV